MFELLRVPPTSCQQIPAQPTKPRSLKLAARHLHLVRSDVVSHRNAGAELHAAARAAGRHACELDRGAESMSAKLRIVVIAGTPTQFDVPGDEASLCTRILAVSACSKILLRSEFSRCASEEEVLSVWKFFANAVLKIVISVFGGCHCSRCYQQKV